MGQRVDPAERLLDLVIALTHAERRMTKAQIRATVKGYGTSVPDDTFERMFERDKDALRDLGIPLVTEVDATHGDDVGYRIDVEGYELPPIDLTPQEVGVLSLAAQLWADATLSAPAARGLTKLRAVAPSPEADATAGLALRLRTPDAAFAAVLTAITERTVVGFSYRAASTGELTRRTVEPWRLVNRRRAWYLVGLDRDRGAPRAFRLSRIEGRVRPQGPPGAVVLPDHVDLGPVLDRAVGQQVLARLAVLPDRAAALRARAGEPTPAGDRDEIVVPFDDTDTFAEQLAGYAEAVVVLDPPDLREAVLRRLRAAAVLDRPGPVAEGDGGPVAEGDGGPVAEGDGGPVPGGDRTGPPGVERRGAR